MRMVDLIVKKRQGEELTDEEIRYWIKGYVAGDIPDYQAQMWKINIQSRHQLAIQHYISRRNHVFLQELVQNLRS